MLNPRWPKSLCTLMLSCLATTAMAQAPANSTPAIFAPGQISGPANDWTPTFTPDGKTLYFARSGVGIGFILESHLTGDRWSEPVLASFSGEWPDSSPAMAPDGSYMVFESTRPATPALAAQARVEHKRLHTSALWRVDRKGAGWSEPVRLPDTVNITDNMWKPSVAGNGDLYFISKNTDEKNLHLYRSRYVNGTYQQAEPLPFSDGKTLDVDPAVAADSSYLVFSSSGRGPFKDDHEHLYIVFPQTAGWSAPAAICYTAPGNGSQTLDDDAVIGPDGVTLYFASDRPVPESLPKNRAAAEQLVKDMQGWNDGNANVWSLSLAPWLTAAHDGKPMPACAAS